MGTTTLNIFIAFISIVTAVIVVGVLLFTFQYRKKKVLEAQDKENTDKLHKLDLLNLQVQIQRETMEFIGSEIHDSVTQKLTLASIYVQKMEYENRFPALSQDMKGISAIINDSLEELRNLSRSLTNRKLRESDLGLLMQLECDRVNDTGVIQATFSKGQTVDFSVTEKSFLYRIVQEFVQNSLKHAECSRLTMELGSDEMGYQVKLTDNGKGFDVAAVSSDGIGLNNMRRRVQLIGGSLQLESAPGRGTQLTIRGRTNSRNQENYEA